MIARTPPHDPLTVEADEPPIDRAAAFVNRHAQTVRYVACGLLGFIVQASLSAGDFTRMAVGVGVFVAFWFVWKQTRPVVDLRRLYQGGDDAEPVTIARGDLRDLLERVR